ncbi:MAG: hypothetical protein ACRDV3_02055 [Acidothermaceae bacterium]
MGFLDKAKATATQAMQQGQAKVGAIQQGRAESDLYRTLGEATYRAQRQGGDPAAVEAGIAALDTHFAQVAEAAAAAAAAAAAGPATASAAAPGASPASDQMGAPAPAPTTPQAAPPTGNFTLDDM